MNALVTGAGRGIGRAIALALASEGYLLVLVSRTVAELENVKKEISAKGGKAFVFGCDISHADEVAKLGENVKRTIGDIDLLINNAGIAPSAKLEDTTDELWANTFAVNVSGAFYLARTFVPAMKEKKSGKIVTIASTAALEGFNYTSAYTASKHAVLGLSRALGAELKRFGIGVFAICPGFVRTAILDASIENIVKRTAKTASEAESELAKLNRDGKIIAPEDVAGIVLRIARGEEKEIVIVL
jgi:NAD(P)-dependent dehydrogenase (short-subunit alcohol dehydrogenase family)